MQGVYSKIEAYISRRGMYKIDLCRQIGMTANGYAAMVKSNTIKLSTLVEIARTLKAPLTDLLNEEIKASFGDVPESEIQLYPGTSVAHTIKPELLEPESIDQINQLPISEEARAAILSERISLLQLHLKIALERNSRQQQQIEDLQNEIDRSVQ